MKKIIKNRGEGKTTDLIKISAEKQIPIVVHNRGMIGIIQDKAKRMGLNIPTPIYALDEHRLSMLGIEGVLVDEIDLVLQEMLHYNIEALTLSPSEGYIGTYESHEIPDTLNDFLKTIVKNWSRLSSQTIREIEGILPTGYNSKLYELKAESLIPKQLINNTGA